MLVDDERVVLAIVCGTLVSSSLVQGITLIYYAFSRTTSHLERIGEFGQPIVTRAMMAQKLK